MHRTGNPTQISNGLLITIGPPSTPRTRYLFFGLGSHHAVTPFIWTSVVCNVLATALISVRALRENHAVLVPACFALFLAIWVEKGLGLVIPGFIPSPLGEVVEYLPTWVEIFVTLGVIAFGLFTLTALLKVFIHVETGAISSKGWWVAPHSK